MRTSIRRELDLIDFWNIEGWTWKACSYVKQKWVEPLRIQQSGAETKCICFHTSLTVQYIFYSWRCNFKSIVKLLTVPFCSIILQVWHFLMFVCMCFLFLLNTSNTEILNKYIAAYHITITKFKKRLHNFPEVWYLLDTVTFEAIQLTVFN